MDCTTDPTIVACTNEAQGREDDTWTPVPTPTPVATVAAVPATPAATTVVVAREPDSNQLASTGVPVGPYCAIALTLCIIGALIKGWVRTR